MQVILRETESNSIVELTPAQQPAVCYEQQKTSEPTAHRKASFRKFAAECKLQPQYVAAAAPVGRVNRYDAVSVYTTRTQGYAVHVAEYNEQKFLADRCRMIRLQILEQAVANGQQGGNGYIHVTIMRIEDYLHSVRSPLAFQMLGDLQAAGFNEFDRWCTKYGV